MDGQQRVITLAVLCTAIRDFYFQPDSAGFGRLTTTFLNYSANISGTEIGSPRLRVQAPDAEAYARITSPKTSLDSLGDVLQLNHRIAGAYKFFMEALAIPVAGQAVFLSEDLDRLPTPSADDEAEVEEGGEQADSMVTPGNGGIALLPASPQREWADAGLLSPERLLAIIENRLKFAVVDLTRSDEKLAFEIFETLNDAGLPLSNVEKFRNGYFVFPDDADEIYDNFWVPLERTHTSGPGRTSDLKTLEDFFFNETIRKFGWTPSDRTYQRLIGFIKARVQTVPSGPRPNQVRASRLAVLRQELGEIVEFS